MREIDQIVGLRSKLGFPLLGNPHRPIPHGAGGDVVAKGVVGIFPDGSKNYPAARSPGRADAATTHGAKRKPPPARRYRSKVDSTRSEERRVGKERTAWRTREAE